MLPSLGRAGAPCSSQGAAPGRWKSATGLAGAKAKIDRPAGVKTPTRQVHQSAKRDETETSVSAEEQQELLRLLEENRRLRRSMTETASHLSDQQLKSFAKEYSSLAEDAKETGVSVDSSLLQVANVGASAAAPQQGFHVQDPTSSSDSGGANNGSKALTSRDYMLEMASVSVELDHEEATTSASLSSQDNDDPAFTPGSRFEELLARKKQSLDEAYQEHKRSIDEQAASPSSNKAIRAAARKQVANHSALAVAADRHHWMLLTVPEKPVAGEELVVYFNRAQSDSLRYSPKVVMQYGFNKWELMPEGSNRADCFPSSIPKDQGADFWGCKIAVPENVFEVNFIFTDGEDHWENNLGQDFTFPVQAGITWDDWVDSAADRAAAAEAARREVERVAAEEAERQRQIRLKQQDEDLARKAAEDLRNTYNKQQEKAFKPGTFVSLRTLPSKPQAGTRIKLQYNRMQGPISPFPIPDKESLTLLYGFNQWQQPGKVQMQRAPRSPSGEDWWEADIDVPETAAVMNFVINFYEHWDNNNKQDYNMALGLPEGQTSVDSWIAASFDKFLSTQYSTRMAREAEERQRQARKDADKARAQEMVKAVERRKVRHVLYTEPEVVRAGQEVTVYYNPNSTVLNGRQSLFLTGGWNRWTHKRKFGPVQLAPPKPGQMHYSAKVKVPGDAYKMDFVFSDVASGDGTYDNRNGLDYHLPVEGSPVREPSLYVAHISVEMAPICKVGGLGDVVTALGRAVKEQGHNVEVIIPRYEFFSHSPVLASQMTYETEFDWGGTRIVVTTAVVENLRCFFIDPRNGFFNTPTVYGRYDDEVRFDFFCKAALEFLLKTGRQPDILHCHDWSTANVAKSYWQDYNPYGLWKPKVIFTIHNLNYGQKKISEAAYFCQKFTTVSPTYAYETVNHPSIAANSYKYIGILNGIDTEIWSPDENPWLPMPYSAENVVEGKKAARKALRDRLGLTHWNDKFVVGVVSRLTGQKGVHLIKHAAWRTLDRGGQFVLLGSAPDPKVQAEFDGLKNSMGGADAAFQFKYDEPLSHLIYAACDIVLVPSMFEPCGLTQMIAMRYGSVPVVRHTGGLRDTVFDVDFDKARAAWDVYGSSDWQRDGLDGTNGFAFAGTDGGALDSALNRAIDAWYNDRTWFHGLQKRIMEQDWSWNRPAIDYIELYHAAQKV